MIRQGNPYVYLVVVVALVLAATAVDATWLQVLLGALGVAVAVQAVVLFLRQARDPNGPPGQH